MKRVLKYFRHPSRGPTVPDEVPESEGDRL